MQRVQHAQHPEGQGSDAVPAWESRRYFYHGHLLIAELRAVTRQAPVYELYHTSM